MIPENFRQAIFADIRDKMAVQQCLSPEDVKLFTDGMILSEVTDSLGLIELSQIIDEDYGIDVLDDIDRDDTFRSVVDIVLAKGTLPGYLQG